MAQSDYALFALDQDGNPSQGQFKSPNQVEVQIYKNFLYVQDPETWTAGAFLKPTVMRVNSGSVQYRDVYIFAVNGPQQGIYAAAWSWSRDPSKTGSDSLILTGMIGCGVYGHWGEDCDFGVQPESRQWFAEFIHDHEKEISRARVPLRLRQAIRSRAF